MWLDELETRLKVINHRIDTQHKKIKEEIQSLKDSYIERDNTVDTLLKTEEYDEQNN